jgi:hypothetical protein
VPPTSRIRDSGALEETRYVHATRSSAPAPRLSPYMPTPTRTELTPCRGRAAISTKEKNPERSARIGLCPPTDVEDHNGLSNHNRGRGSGAHPCNPTKRFGPNYKRGRNIAGPAPLGFPEHGYRHRSPIREDERDGHKHNGRHSKLVRLSWSGWQSIPSEGAARK